MSNFTAGFVTGIGVACVIAVGSFEWSQLYVPRYPSVTPIEYPSSRMPEITVTPDDGHEATLLTSGVGAPRCEFEADDGRRIIPYICVADRNVVAIPEPTITEIEFAKLFRESKT